MRSRSSIPAGVAAVLLVICLAAAPATQPADMMHFHKVSITDPKMQNAEACTLLVPEGWKTGGEGIVWDLRQTFFPAALDLRVTGPDGRQEVGFYPAQRFYWFNNPMGQRLVPVGSRYLGAVVEPVVSDCKTAMTRIVWPATHGNIKGAKVVEFTELPDFAKACLAQYPQSPAVQYAVKAGKLRVEYADPKTGAAMQEDIIGVLTIVQYTQLQSTGWQIDKIFSYKSPAGQLDNNEKMMEVVTSSIRLDPRWYAGCVQVVQTLAQIEKNASDAAAQRANIQFKAQQQISDEQQKAWEKNQAAVDQCNEAFDQTLRGVQLYQNSDGSKVELPLDYSHAWSNGAGDYIVSNNALYNPNANKQGSWQELKSAEH